jgi:hypothetical protein
MPSAPDFGQNNFGGAFIPNYDMMSMNHGGIPDMM